MNRTAVTAGDQYSVVLVELCGDGGLEELGLLQVRIEMCSQELRGEVIHRF